MDTKERDEDEVVEEEAWDKGVLAHQPSKSSAVARASMRSRAPIDINLRRARKKCKCGAALVQMMMMSSVVPVLVLTAMKVRCSAVLASNSKQRPRRTEQR